MRVFVVTPPDPVVSYADAVARLRLASDGEQADVEAMIAAATATIDGPGGWLGRSIGVQTLEARLDTFCGDLKLPYPPIADVMSVKYIDAAGTLQTVSPSDYYLAGADFCWADGFSPPATKAQREAVRIQYDAGYEDVPPNILAAILLMVGDLYANRETAVVGTVTAAVPMSTTVEALLAPSRVFV